MKSGNLSSIAKIAGVSISTASRVLSGKAEKTRISKETAEKVYSAASKLNYSPSILARSLNHERSKMVGLLLPTVSNPFFAEMASIIISECRLRGYTIIMMDSAENENLFIKSISAMVSRNVDGIIAAPCGKEPLFLESINRDFCPVILVDRIYEDCKLSYVTTDNYQGGCAATQMLLSAGHTSIACIQGEVNSMPNVERVRGFMDTMTSAGLENGAKVVGSAFSLENGYREVMNLLSEDNPPSALFTLSSTITLGAIRAAREKGLVIGKDISIVSFDNNINLNYFSPPITMIGQPVEDMAVLSVKILVSAIDGGQKSFSHLRLAPTVIQGQSVAIIG